MERTHPDKQMGDYTRCLSEAHCGIHSTMKRSHTPKEVDKLRGTLWYPFNAWCLTAAGCDQVGLGVVRNNLNKKMFADGHKGICFLRTAPNPTQPHPASGLHSLVLPLRGCEVSIQRVVSDGCRARLGRVRGRPPNIHFYLAFGVGRLQGATRQGQGPSVNIFLFKFIAVR